MNTLLMLSCSMSRLIWSLEKSSCIVLRPGSSKTISVADCAASEAPSTAIPQSAFLREGASLIPSPVIAVIWPRCSSVSTT
ncbi:hypothetical protein V1506DRAFT_546425 [Lipomyces tetrasporus]